LCCCVSLLRLAEKRRERQRLMPVRGVRQRTEQKGQQRTKERDNTENRTATENRKHKTHNLLPPPPPLP